MVRYRLVPVLLLAALLPAATSRPVAPAAAGRTLTYDGRTWPALQPGDTVRIPWRAEPYPLKLHIWQSDITIQGVPGPNGELPCLIGHNAVEVPTPGYWSKEVANAGLIVVAPPAGYAYDGAQIRGITIRSLELRGANQDAPGFINTAGNPQGWTDTSAGVALYRCANVLLEELAIHDCGNGIFGKSFAGSNRVLRNVTVQYCTIQGNGVVGNSHKHNIYLESDGATYRWNRILPLRDGAGGVGLKDRSARTTVAENYIEGGAFCLDLVEPDDGGATLAEVKGFGTQRVTGNVLVNTQGRSAVHFGWDQVQKYGQKECRFAYNTVVNVNNQAGGFYYTYFFKVEGGAAVIAHNNVFHAVSPDPQHGPGDLYFASQEYGTASVSVGTNWVPAGVRQAEGDPVVTGWDQLLRGEDPGFRDAVGRNFGLTKDSPCRGKARPLPSGWKAPSKCWDALTGWWSPRKATASLGAVE